MLTKVNLNQNIISSSNEAYSYNSTLTNNFKSENNLYKYSENTLLGTGRINRYSLPVINYDYKCGNYLGI
jgi:hypothetical protein